MAEKDYVVVMNGKSKSYTEDQFNSPEMQNWLNSTEGVESYEVSPYDAKEEALDGDSFQLTNDQGQSKNYSRADFERPEMQNWIKANPDYKVSRVRPVLNDAQRKAKAHNDLVDDLAGRREQGEEWAELNDIQNQIIETRKALDNFDKKSSDELANIPGARERVNKQAQQMKTRGQLLSSLRELEDKYYNHNLKIQQRVQGKQGAQVANENLDKLFAPYKEEAQRQRSQRSPMLATVPFGGAYAQPTNEEVLYTAAKNLNDDTVRLYDAPSKYGKENGFDNYLKGAGDRASQVDFWTMGLTGIVDQYALKGVLDKIRTELGGMKELTAENIDETLSPMEKEVLSAFLRNADAQADRAQDLSRGYQAGQGAMDSAMFMAQFILSGAITSGAVDILSSGAAKGLSQWISNVIGKEAKTAATTAVKKAVGRLSGDAAEAVVYSMLQPGTMKSILEAQNSLDETGEIVDQRNAAFKGYLDYLVEVFSEHTGDYLGNVVGSLGGKKLVNALSQTEFGKWGKAFLSSDKVKALRAGQWHGFLGEVSEEFIGAAMRDLSGLDPDAWEEQTKGENLAIMALSFLPMTLIGGTASTVKYAAARSDFKESDENLRNIMGTLGFDKEQIDHATDVTRLSSPEEIENTVKPILKEMRQRGASEEELRSVMDFAFNAARINVYDSFRETEAQEKRDAVQAELVGTYGDFWQGDEEKTVQRTTLPDGRSGYVKGANEEGEMIVLLDDGSTAFAKDTDVTTETLDQYLDSVILARKEQEDAEIVEEEARDARQTFQQRIAERAPIEMGTPENPISGTLVTNMDPKLGEIPARDENGNYLVQTSAQDEDGISNTSFVPLSENDLARKWGIELNPKTQEELEADQLEAYQTAQARKDLYNIIPAGTEVQATLEGLDSPVKYSFVRAVYDEDSQAVQVYVEDMDTHEEVMLPESAIPGLEQLAAEQTQKAEQEAESEEVAEESAVEEAPEVLRDFKGNPIPLKEDGSVDKTAFWTKDPEAWAAWNDSQRNDGGADTIEYVSAAVKKAEGDLKKLNAAKSKELDFDKRDALEAKKKPLEERIAALNNILTGYKNRQEKEKEQAKPVESKPAEVIPSNVTDEVREFFSALNKRGELRGKLNKADFKRELGWGEAETKPFFGWWAKKGQGRTLVSLAEELANDYDSQYNYIHLDGDHKDTQEARSAIIEVLYSASKPSEVFSIEAQEENDPYTDDMFAEALMIQEAKEREEMEWIEESAGSADLAAVDQENYTNFTSEYYNYYGQTESAGALESPQVGAEAVPGSESDDAGRILSVGEQPGEAAVSNADEGGVVPGAEPGGQDALAGGEQGAVEGPGADAQSTQEVVQGSLDFENETQAAVAAAEAEVDQNPTEAQKEAGNYKKGHVTIDGYDITIENPKGSVRSGVDASGREWSQTMNNTYGYIRMTEGVDGDHIDVFLSDNPEQGDVFVVDQVNKDGSFDEHKVMYGFPDEESARAAYLSNYEEGWTGLGNITGVTKDEFKKWVESSHRKTKPFAEYKSVNTINEEPQAPERESARSERVAKITADIEKIGELDKEYDRLWKEWLSDNSIDNIAQRLDLYKQQSSLERSIKASLAWATEEELDEVGKIDSKRAKELVADERKRRGASKRHSRVSAIIAERQSVPKVKAKALGKLNLYNYTDHDEFRPALNGVFHDDGFAVATDSHFLVAIKEGYDKKNNGKVIHKDGKEIMGTYPKWRMIIPNGETQKMDFSALRDFLAGVKEAQEKKYESLSDEEKKKSKKKEMVNRSKIILNVGNDLNIAFWNEELTKFADNAERIGAKELIFSDERRAVAAKTSKGVVLVMPIRIDWRDDKEEDEGYQADELMAGGTYSFGKNEYQKSLETQPTLTEAQKKSLAFIENKSTEEVTEEVRQQPLKDRIKAWEDRTGQKVETIEKFDDVKDKTARAAILTGQNPSGWFDTKTGRVVIYLPNVKTESEIDQTYMHEIVSHKGLRELLGQERFNALMDSVWDDIMSEEDRKYWLDYNSHLTDLDEQGLRRAAADEYVANLAENVDSNPTAWERFVEKVKEILNKLGFDLKITDADLRTLLQASLANYERQQRELRAQAEAQQQAREDTQAFLDGKRTRNADTAAAQSAPQAVVSESREKYEDFGEKIGWARKDLAKKGIKKGDGDSRPAWLKKYQTQNVEEVPEQVKAAAEKMGIRSNGFVPVAQDIIKGTDFTKPFIAYYEKKSKGYFGNRVAKRYIIGEDRQPIVFTSLEQYEAAVPVFEAHDQGYRVKQNGDKFFIVRPASNGKVVEYAQFDTKEEATAYLTSPEGCVSLLNKKRENYELPALEELTRNNMPDYRKGKNITPQDILDTFGFRGGEFGNWLNAEERQQFLNYAYDALMDLANVIGASPKALSLNGELSIAFGARGHQGAKAHYEPTKAVINLTKMNGAGSLAHEWAHALDNYFGIMDAKTVRNREKEVEENLHYLSEGPSWKRGAREEMREAFKNVMDTIKGKVVTRQIALDKAQKEYDDMFGYARRQLKNQYREQFARGLTKYQYNRKTKERDVVKIVPTEEQLAEYDRLTALLETDPTFKFDWDYKKAAYRASGDVASQLYELVKDVMPNRGGDRYGPLHNAFYYLDKALPLRERLEKAKAGETETVKIKTAVLEDSQWFDRGRAGEYWQKDVELFARSFETYVSSELKSNNQSSDYLTYEKGPLYQKLWDHNPYPAGEERDAVKKAFDHFFDVIQEKSDEQTGRQVLFRKFKDEESQYLFDRAKEFFGTTNDLNEAGYILPDGSMLDFSGRHQVEGDSSFLRGRRTVDHRDIFDLAYEKDGWTETGIETDMADFINRGAIRIDSNAGAINLSIIPTEQQISKLSRLIEKNGGDVYVDFGAPDTDHYAEYSSAKASRVINDIKRYFTEGYKPEGNIMFRKAPNGQPSNLTAEQWEMVRTPEFKKWFGDWENDPENASKVVDENGEPKVMYHGTELDYFNNGEPFYVFDDASHFGTKEVAERVAKSKAMETHGNTPYVYSVFLKIVNPKRVPDVPKEWNSTHSEYWLEQMHLAVDEGYDGLVYSNEYEDRKDNEDSYLPFYQNQIKSATDNTGAFSPENPDIRFRITPEQDKEYLEAVERGDMATAQRMVDDAAKLAGMATNESGKLIDLYHGTPNFGFTIYNTRNGLRPIFTTTKRNVSANYAGNNHYAGVRRINKGYKGATTTDGIIQDAKSVLGQEWRLATEEEKQRIIEETEKEAKKVAAEIEKLKDSVTDLPEDGELDIANATAWVEDLFYTVSSAKENGNDGEDLYRLVSDGVERYVENKQVIRDYLDKHYDELDDAQKEYLTYLVNYRSGDVAIDISYSYKDALSGKELTTVDGDSLVPIERLRETVEQAHNIGSYHVYGDLGSNPLVVDAGGKQWYSFDFNGERTNSDALAAYARDNGYTSLVIKNVYDYGDLADDYVFFEPSRIKSADPATYDNEGNLIPLSRRFNNESGDVRFRMVQEDIADLAGATHESYKPDNASYYAKGTTQDGESYEIRVADHPANINNFKDEDGNLPDNILSIIVSDDFNKADAKRKGQAPISDEDKNIYQYVVDPSKYDEDKDYIAKMIDRFKGHGSEPMLSDIRFRLSPEMDAAYEKAVNDGNDEKVRKMILDAAKAAMPNTKVVGKNGYPKVVYHGTPSEEAFNEFRDGMIFFTTDKGNATSYAHERRVLSVNPIQTGRVMPCFVNLENPLVVDANRRLWNNISVDWQEEPMTAGEIADYAKENGYDGVIIKRVRDNMFNDMQNYADDVIAFDSSQVKTTGAVYNREVRWHFPWDEHDELKKEFGPTFDKGGNLIPLSQRFNTNKEDIRFRKEEPTPEELLAKVQEFGLRGVMDKEQVAEYYADALRLMPEETRNEVIDKAFGKDLNVRRQTKEYLASLALKGYAEDQSGLLRALANKIQESIPTDKLSENELLYMIWRDANRYSNMDLLSLAQDIALRRRLRVADYSGEKFPTEMKEAISRAETRIDQAEETREAERQAARKEVKKSPLSSITKAMMAQRGYDQETVNSIVALAKDMIKRGSLDSTTSREMARLLTIIKDAVGRKPAAAKESAKKLLDFMIDHELKTERELLDKMLKVKTATVKKPGVDVQAKLDIHTQGVINAFKENVKKSEAEIRTAISNLEDKMENASEARKEEIQSELEGLNLALQYATEIDANVKENEAIRQQIADAKKEFDELPEAEKKQFRSALNQEVEASYEKIRENRIERVNAFRELRAAVAEVLSEGTEKAKSFIERERARVNQIHHEANSDMQGVDDDPIEPKSSVMTKLTNNQVARFLTAPLATFDQMLRLLGRKHPNGQGYLWTRYMTQRRAADDNEKLGLDAANDTLNAKVQEIFKDPTMTWNDLYHLERGMDKATIKFFNANGEWKEEELTQGNLLYIYMVDKMTDGQMKLRQMNITEEKVREIKKALDPRFVKLADWMQGEFLPQLRDKYNEVHKRLFGTSMASIENYFPLRILGGVIKEEIDLSNPDSDALPSAMTGAIIKRTVNRKQLDITNSDAFSVMIEHVQEMEHWAAFAEFNKDLSTLLSYKRFQNQVKHLNTVYGSGKNLWGSFKKVAVLAAGEYRPARTPLDTAAVNLAKGVSTAKIAFRAYTALKQILSWPAFLADANIVELAKATSPTNWKENWDWAMQNLPNFKKRVEKRTVGNEKLEADELDAPIWSTGLAQWISKYGMSMNAFVDALTVSIGAKAMYETKYKQYTSEGYAPRTATKKAMFDAVTLFNETQQSSEKEFMSTMQADKTVVSVALSVYRNASFGYQRQVHQGLRTLSRLASKGYKEKSLEYMTKQLVRDGLTEEQAKSAAEKRYEKSLAGAVTRVAVFGWLMQFAWNLGTHAIYLLFGNDPDEKNEMLAQDAKKALSGGMIEGLAGGSIMSDLLSKFENGESIYGYDMNTLPIMQDIKNTIAKFNTDPVAAANDLVFLGVQIGLGTNPQTFSDAILAIVDACNGDFGTAKEAMLCILRILQVPQSQLDELMIDEIGMTAGQARELTYEEVAQRYADYKVRRNAPITGALYSDELREKREKAAKTTFKKKYNKRQE